MYIKLSSKLFVLLIVSACSSDMSQTSRGALTGAAIGGGAGAIVGSSTGDLGAATAIGVGAGALGGALVGSTAEAMDAKEKRQEAERFKNAQEAEKQERELEQIRRQQRYDDAFQRY